LPAVARGLAFFLGSFSLLNVMGDLLSPGFDANHSWIDLRPIHSPAADICLRVWFYPAELDQLLASGT